MFFLCTRENKHSAGARNPKSVRKPGGKMFRSLMPNEFVWDPSRKLNK